MRPAQTKRAKTKTKRTRKRRRPPRSRIFLHLLPLEDGAAGAHHGTDHGALRCDTCHSGWLPSCYGCHVDLDMTQTKAYQTTGEEVAGRPTGSRRWVTLYDMVLMRNSEGKMAPSMPAERFFMTVTDWLDGDPASGEKEPVYDT